jgi:hypothetical protein
MRLASDQTNPDTAAGSRAFLPGPVRSAVVVLLAVAVMGGSYAGVYTWRVRRETARMESVPTAQEYPSGTYLTAYMIMSSKCHFCTSESAKAAIRGLRAAVRHAAGSRYAGVSVVGVAIDADMGSEIKFIQAVGGSSAFDQISVGGGWLNQLLAKLSWQDGFAEPAVPEIVFTRRQVNSAGYPQMISIGPETLLFHKTGDGALAWIDTLERGGPLPFGSE